MILQIFGRCFERDKCHEPPSRVWKKGNTFPSIYVFDNRLGLPSVRLLRDFQSLC